MWHRFRITEYPSCMSVTRKKNTVCVYLSRILFLTVMSRARRVPVEEKKQVTGVSEIQYDLG